MELRNLASVHDSGVRLSTREVAAILREVSATLQDADDNGAPLTPPSLDELRVTEDGQLIVTSGSATAPADSMPMLATLIEQLLPPSVRTHPETIVPASFRMLAPRVRGWPPGLPRIETPGALASAVTRYLEGRTAASVLQELFARTALPRDGDSAFSAAIPAAERQPAVDAADEIGPPSVPTPEVASSSRWFWTRDARVLLLLASLLVLSLVVRSALDGARRAAAAAESAPREAPMTPMKEVDRGNRGSAAQASPNGADPSGGAQETKARRVAATPPRASRGVVGPGGVAPMPMPAPVEIPDSMGPVFSPSFAASGSALVFHAGREPTARVMSTDLTDGEPMEVVTLVDGSSRNYHPRLSPDGRLLAFDSDRDGVRGVYVANRDGTQVRRVSGAGFAAVPSWSPDMRWLAFVRAEPERPHVWNLWLQQRDTGVLTRLTAHRYGQTWGASWFQDSRRVCYSHETRLVVRDITSGEERTFASPQPGRLVRTPAVSPDGQRVAFQVLRNGVWLLDVASGAMWRIIEDPTAEEFAWDPLGQRLAYHSRSSGEWKIWVAAIPSRGTEP